MPINFNDENWAHWVRLEYWSHLEAALIIDGIIPSKRHLFDLETEWKATASEEFASNVVSEPTTEIFLAMLERRFESKKIDPRECLLWSQQLGIVLDKNLMVEAIKYRLIAKSAKADNSEIEIDESKSGRHWLEMRNKILSRALYIINDPPPDCRIFHKSSGKLNLTKLSTAVFEFGHELQYKKGGSVAPDTIYDTIKEAIKPTQKSKKTRK